MAALTAAMSLCSLAIIVLTVALVGLPGWVIGRYLGEACFGLALLVVLCSHIRFRGPLSSAYTPSALLGLGVPITLTLLLRRVQDNLGLMLLGVLGFDSEAIGYYGISTLLVTAGLLLPGAVANFALPHLASRTRHPDQLWLLYARLLRGSLAVSLASAIAVVAVALALPRIIGPDYTPAVPLLALLATVIPFRGVATAAAVLLLAYDRALLILVINVSALASAVALCVTLAPTYGLYGVALGTLLVEILTMLAFVLAAWILQCYTQRSSKVTLL
jgi:O-antigen/teichoic acid export membrane protein